MGYYTNYTVWIDKKDKTKKTAESILRVAKEINDKIGFTFFDLDSFNDEYSAEAYYGDIKWYHCEADLAEVARQFPDWVITVEGEGEEREDWWVAKFCGNKSIRKEAIIEFPWDLLPEDENF